MYYLCEIIGPLRTCQVFTCHPNPDLADGHVSRIDFVILMREIGQVEMAFWSQTYDKQLFIGCVLCVNDTPAS